MVKNWHLFGRIFQDKRESVTFEKYDSGDMPADRAKIMVVDDDPNICLLLTHLLEKKYALVAHDSGLAALAWLRQYPLPDLIILDLYMPEPNGIELLKTLKTSGFYRNIPVMILTGYEDEDTQRLCRATGAEDFMSKPFKPAQLLSRIQQLLEVRSSFATWY